MGVRLAPESVFDMARCTYLGQEGGWNRWRSGSSHLPPILVPGRGRAINFVEVALGTGIRREQMPRAPHLVILAGPNGAGKSTSAAHLLAGRLRVEEFVNADTIARGLSAFKPEGVAVEAGRAMLRRIEVLVRAHRSFAFETTLASKALEPRLLRYRESGYLLDLVFLWLPSADFAVARVRERVRSGGHDVPEETIRRRYARGVRNLFAAYMPLVTGWRVYDGSRPRPELVALRTGARTTVRRPDVWARIQEASRGG